MPEDDRILAPAGGLFSCEMAVRWGDMDALGHVNNTVYFRYFEEARLALLECAGLLPDADRAWVLAHASCDFIKPLLYPARIVVVLELLNFGRSSLELEVSIALASERDTVVARGRNVVVSIDPRTGRSAALAQEALGRLGECFVVPPHGV